MSSSMTPNDRETLSALFDGELEGDAARFAMRRLDHDAGWRDACSRWQLAGDVLRGQAEGLAPAGFAQRVSAALAAEASLGEGARAAAGQTRRSPAATAQARSRRWWGRGALAASVAVAALFVAHPFSDFGAQDGSADPAPVAAFPAPTPQIAVDDAAGTTALPAGAEVAAAAAVVADVPRRVVERRSRVRQVAAAPASEARPGDVAARQPAPSAAEPGIHAGGAMVAGTTAAAATPDPFSPRADTLITRPWPRAVLPGAQAGSFTASFGTAQSSPSFYPFEPDPSHVPQPVSQSPSTPKPQP